jgi:signal transduction histidine kinase
MQQMQNERIARELHDVVIQRLFAVGLCLDALSHRLPDPASDEVIHAADELNQTIQDIRAAIVSLQRGGTSGPLREELAGVIGQAEHTIGFAPDVCIRGPVDALPERVHRQLLATLSEALSNVARYAHASHVQVSINANRDELVAVVSHDGLARPEQGLATLRRRAELVGGAVTTEPGDDGPGLMLTWRVPLRRGPGSDGSAAPSSTPAGAEKWRGRVG